VPSAESDHRSAVQLADHQIRRVSLGSRVSMLAALGVAVAVGLVSLAVYLTVRNSLYTQVDDNLQQRASNVLNATMITRDGFVQVPPGLLDALDVRLDVIDGNGDSVLHLQE